MEKEDLNKVKIIDKIRLYQKTDVPTCTSFLSPGEILENENLLKKIPHIITGSYDEAERKIIIIGTEEADIEDYFTLVEVSSNSTLAHREVLGSVLGTGIKRDVVGDIIINDSIAYVIVLKEISKYLIQNIDKVGREKVKVKIVTFDEIKIPEKHMKEIQTTVSSLRLDALISACYGISREISLKLVETGKVNINYKEAVSNSKKVAQGDLVSCRGYGRFEVKKIVGETRKGRIRVVLNRF